MDFLAQCENWFNEKEYALIINKLENLPTSEQSPELALVLAKTYFSTSSGWKDRTQLQKALRLFLSLEKRQSGNFEWNYWLGKTYLALDQFGRALEVFKTARTLNPHFSDLKDCIDRCRELLNQPKFSEPFLSRTMDAWKAFSAIEPLLLENIQQFPLSSEKISEVSDMADKAFELAMDNPGFVLAQGDDKYGLIFSPKGSWAHFFEQCIIVSQSPQYVRQNWELLIGALPTNYMHLELFGVEFCSKNASVWLEKQKKGYKLSIYDPNLANLPKELKDIYPQLATDYIDNAIGELPRMKFFEKPEFLDSSKEAQPIPLQDLYATLRKEGFELSLDPMVYLTDFEPYQSSAAKGFVPESEYGKARSDILKGYTTFRDLLIEYSRKQNDIVNMLIADGAIPGFIFFSPPVKNGVENAENIEYSRKLQRYLVDSTTPQAITLTGVASGFAWWYVDFIAWDISNVLEIAQNFFRENPPLFCGFQVFHTESEPDLWHWLWK